MKRFAKFSCESYCHPIHSHTKRKDSLDQVLYAAELGFPKIIKPRLPWYTSDVNIECTGKSVCSKQLYYLYVTIFLEH